jgi:GNAT superfamily N-acetyltransferase
VKVGDRVGDRVSLRPAVDDDQAFLLAVYAGTRADELALVDWDDARKAAFVRMQFEAQHAYYREQYPDAAFDVILLDGEAAGRLYLNRSPDEIRIVDIALLPDRRGQGIGSVLMARIQDEAAREGKPLRIHVERFNPALRWYEKLGFAPVADRGVYLFLEWRAPTGNDVNG